MNKSKSNKIVNDATETVKNNYDSYAKKWADYMRSGQNLPHEYLEKPAMYKIAGDLIGQSVLCVGCGSGEECNVLLKNGAKNVVGIDLSSGLINEAKTAFPNIEFYVMSVEKLDFTDNKFDVIYSSLVMHYLLNWDVALSEMYRVLKPGGRLIFSTHHPTMWGAEIVRDDKCKSKILGSKTFHDDKTKIQTFGDYFTERMINDVWFGDFHVSFYHRPLESLMADILRSDFTLRGFYEPQPIKEIRKIDPRFWLKHSKIPTFLIFVLEKAR
jgi:ubiquinone/menaquinone biosynthesis C-methylase UbiE